MLKELTKNKKPLVPDNFYVPTELKTPKFTIRVLREADVTKDYQAVLASVARLRGVFGPYEPNWPPSDLTLEQDREDLTWHEGEFSRRTSFTYTVATPDETKCLGCVYIFPSPKTEFDAIVFLWTSSEAANLDHELFETVQRWLASDWPFKNITFPGRTLPWSQWNLL